MMCKENSFAHLVPREANCEWTTHVVNSALVVDPWVLMLWNWIIGDQRKPPQLLQDFAIRTLNTKRLGCCRRRHSLLVSWYS